MSTINYLTRIEFGAGEVARLPEFLAALGIRRPLIATDKGLVAAGLVERVRVLTREFRHCIRQNARQSDGRRCH